MSIPYLDLQVSLPVAGAILAYLISGCVLAGARSYFSSDVSFLFAIIWPVHSFFLRPRREYRRRSWSFSIPDPIAELISFGLLATSIVWWFNLRPEISALLWKLFPK